MSERLLSDGVMEDGVMEDGVIRLMGDGVMEDGVSDKGKDRADCAFVGSPHHSITSSLHHPTGPTCRHPGCGHPCTIGEQVLSECKERVGAVTGGPFCPAHLRERLR